MSLLELTDLQKTYRQGDAPAVDGVNLTISPGEFFALLGPSGCGKTTVLRLIAGFERLDRGRIEINNRTVATERHQLPPERRNVGLVFQEDALFPHLTVLENVMFGLHRQPRRERAGQAMAKLELVGLAGCAGRHPGELSGGQQQRVALARSIAGLPSLLLLDEPFSSLDTRLRAETRRGIAEILRREKMTVLLVTHDAEEAMSFADRIGVMRDGQLEQVGTAEELYLRPRNAFIADFLGQTNFIAARAEGRRGQTVLGAIELDRAHQGEVVLSVRPEQIRLQPPDGDRPSLRIIHREFRGDYMDIDVELDGEHRYHIHSMIPCAYERGDHVSVVVDGEGVVLQGEMTT